MTIARVPPSRLALIGFSLAGLAASVWLWQAVPGRDAPLVESGSGGAQMAWMATGLNSAEQAARVARSVEAASVRIIMAVS